MDCIFLDENALLVFFTSCSNYSIFLIPHLIPQPVGGFCQILRGNEKGYSCWKWFGGILVSTSAERFRGNESFKECSCKTKGRPAIRGQLFQGLVCILENFIRPITCILWQLGQCIVRLLITCITKAFHESKMCAKSKQNTYGMHPVLAGTCVHLLKRLLCLIGPCLIGDMISLAPVLELLLDAPTRLQDCFRLMSTNKRGKLIKVSKRPCWKWQSPWREPSGNAYSADFQVRTLLNDGGLCVPKPGTPCAWASDTLESWTVCGVFAEAESVEDAEGMMETCLLFQQSRLPDHNSLRNNNSSAHEASCDHLLRCLLGHHKQHPAREATCSWATIAHTKPDGSGRLSHQGSWEAESKRGTLKMDFVWRSGEFWTNSFRTLFQNKSWNPSLVYN